MSIYLEINEPTLEKLKKEAMKLSKEKSGEEDSEEILFDNLELDYDSSETPIYDDKTNEIQVYGNLKHKDETLGYISMSLELDFDIVIEIIEAYRKRLGKLKTVLEATK